MDILLLTGIFTLGLISGFVGNVMGVGGFVNVPLMIVMGLPPHAAIAANRFGSLGMEAAALARYISTNYIYWPWIGILALLGVAGGVIGSNLVITIAPGTLKGIIAFLILMFVPILLVHKHIGVEERLHAKTKALRAMMLALFFLIMIYGGFLGAGATPLFIMVLCGVGGMTILQAKATTAIPWFCMSLVSTIVFWMNGFVVWSYCLTALAGMASGGYLGTHVAIKIGNRNLRYLFIVFCVITAVALLIR